MIELLVVIAIIALLIGILLPVLGSARRAAWQTVSASNLRQGMVGMANYQFDNDDEWLNPHAQGSPLPPRYADQGSFDWWYAEGDVPAGVSTDRVWNTLGGTVVTETWFSMGARSMFGDRGGVDNTGSTQFHPADTEVIDFFQNEQKNVSIFSQTLIEGEELYREGLWQGSYMYTLATMYQPEKFTRANFGDPSFQDSPNFRPTPEEALARRMRVSDTRYPSSKAILWERADFLKNKRLNAAALPNGRFGVRGTDPGHPAWNNPDADTMVAFADGAVSLIDMEQVYNDRDAVSERVGRAFDHDLRPAGIYDWWAGSDLYKDNFAYANVGMQIGDDSGRFEAFFMATYRGLSGRDVQGR